MRALGPILLTVFLDLLGFGLVIPLLSFYAEDFQASELQVTLLMACYSLAQFWARHCGVRCRIATGVGRSC